MTSTLHISGDLLGSGRSGGLSRYAQGLATALAPIGPTRLMGIGDMRDPNAVADIDMPLWRRFRAIRARVKSTLGGTDLIASHFSLYGFAVLDVLRKHPHVVHFHGPWATESAAEGGGALSVAAKRFIEKRVYATADRAITLSHAFAKILIEEYAVPQDKVFVIPGGIDLPTTPLHVRAGARAQLGWPTDRPIVLCVRRLTRRMGIDVLIDAAAIVRRTRPDVLFFIAGKGSIGDELHARIASASLGEHVKLLGFVPDEQLPLAYAAADLSVVPSQSLEGFGLVTLESLVQGTPVLVTPVGGLPEVVTGLDPKLVLAGTDAQAIADGLASALDAPGTLPGRDACRDYAVAGFGWPTIARRVLDGYSGAIAAAR